MFELIGSSPAMYLIRKDNCTYGYATETDDGWQIELLWAVSLIDYIAIFNAVSDKVQHSRYLEKYGC